MIGPLVKDMQPLAGANRREAIFGNDHHIQRGDKPVDPMVNFQIDMVGPPGKNDKGFIVFTREFNGLLAKRENILPVSTKMCIRDRVNISEQEPARTALSKIRRPEQPRSRVDGE